MIPVKLTLRGIYSYKKESVIDFEKITGDGLFGIFGKVGSGKSTILEAISFVIYSNTERLNTRENRYYNMMNLQSDELSIVFECYAGRNNKERYKFEVKAKRRSSNFEDIATPERKCSRWEGNRYVELEEYSSEKIIGLTYENFRRTTIIPQGKFQEFLHLGDTDRAKMLKELFGLQKFDLSFKVKNLENATIIEHERILAQLEKLADVTNDDLTQKEDEFNSVITRLTEVAASVDNLSEKKSELDTLRELYNRKTTLEEQLRNLELKKDEITQKEESLNNYRNSLLTFKPLIERKRELRISTDELNERIGSIENRLEQLNHKKGVVEKDFNSLKLKKEKELPEIEIKGVAIGDIIKVKNKQNELSDNKNRLLELRSKSSEVLAKFDEYENKLTEKKTNLAKLKTDIPDIKKIGELKHLLQLKQNLEEKKQSLINEQKEKREKIDTRVNSLNIQHEEEGSLFASINLDDETEKLINENEAHKIEIAKQQKRLKSLISENALVKYSDELKPGTPCPLCGSEHHPSPVKDKNYQFSIDAIESQIKNAEKYIEENQRKINEIELVITQNDEDEKYISLKKAEQKNVSAELGEVNSSIEAKGDKTVSLSSLKEEEDQFDRIAAEIKVTENEITQLEHELKSLTQQKEKISESEGALKSGVSAGEQYIAELEKNIPQNIYREYYSTTLNELEELRQDLRNIHSSINKGYEKNREELESLNGKISGFSGELNAHKHNLTAYKKEYENLATKLTREVENSIFVNLEEIENILNHPLDIEATENEINSYKKNVERVNNLLTETNKTINGREYISSEHISINEKLAELKENYSTMQQQKGSLENEIAVIKEKLAIKKELSKENKIKQKRLDALKHFKDMFKRQGFVNFVAREYLRSIVINANERFMKLTNNRLMLEVKEDNNFIVRDLVNGNQVRNVKTLSGGQTFQASLALALALADNIALTAGADQNFFFMDEGFGTLDKESLYNVFNTLRSLKSENRIVGIISHVEELKEEINNYVNVVNIENEGSKTELVQK